MTDDLLLSTLAVTALALVHIFAGKLRFLDVIPRSRWLSFAGGTSVAYVFVHLLPELARAQEQIGDELGTILAAAEHHVYGLALIGLVIFYGLERLADESREESREARGDDTTTEGVFWLHMTSFAIYNFLIGYVLGEREDEPLRLILFFVAMALHFLVNDYGLRLHHKSNYRRVGRWILAAAVLGGWVVGLNFQVSELVLLIPLSFLAGGIVLNVLKEELPEERQSRFTAFALGAGFYAALLMVV